MKTITKDNYTLQYFRYIDDMGFEQDSFELIYTEPNGHRISMPFFGDVKVSVNRRDKSIGSKGYIYTAKDLDKILDEQIKKFKSHTE